MRGGLNEETPNDPVVEKLRKLIAEKVAKVHPGTPEHYRLVETLELSDEALVDYLFAHIEPNPDRVGCPPRAVLIELAQRTRPLTDPWWDHVMSCSPCRIDVRELGRTQRVIAPLGRFAWRRQAWAAAVLLLVTVGLGVWVMERAFPSRGPVAMTGDFRRYALTRSYQPQPLEPILELPQRPVRLTLLLPNGSEPGRYDLEVRGSDGRSLVAAVGEAKLKDYVTSIDAELNLRSVSTGRYELALRRSGEDWQLFPVRID